MRARGYFFFLRLRLKVIRPLTLIIYVRLKNHLINYYIEV